MLSRLLVFGSYSAPVLKNISKMGTNFRVSTPNGPWKQNSKGHHQIALTTRPFGYNRLAIRTSALGPPEKL